MEKIRALLKILGPGLLMAGAAIGVSHLMQSTRAGADYGWQLLSVVLLINAVKYPFFEFGHRYTVATGRTLLDGYRELGRWYLAGFLVLNSVTAVVSIAGVTFVTAALAENLVHFGWTLTTWSAVLMVVCGVIIIVGHYRWLDGIMKVLIVILFLATMTAFVAAFWHGPVAPADFKGPSPWTQASLAFLIALMGWMPAPIELSVWQSLWIKAKERADGRLMTHREAIIDFNTGYILTTFLALVFVALGALVMYGSGEKFQTSGAAFASQLVGLYGKTIGHWAVPVVGMAAFATMFSTTLTVQDAYPRSLSEGFKVAWPSIRLGDRPFHYLLVVAGCVAGLWIIHSYANRLTAMIDLATTICFLAAPPFAWLNYRLVTCAHFPEKDRPGKVMRIFCWLAIMFLAGFGVLYLIDRFG